MAHHRSNKASSPEPMEIDYMAMQKIPGAILDNFRSWNRTLERWENVIDSASAGDSQLAQAVHSNRDLAAALRNSIDAMRRAIRHESGVILSVSSHIDTRMDLAEARAEVERLEREIKSRDLRGHLHCIRCHLPNPDAVERTDDLCPRCRGRAIRLAKQRARDARRSETMAGFKRARDISTDDDQRVPAPDTKAENAFPKRHMPGRSKRYKYAPDYDYRRERYFP
ncbi:hypothetical protein F4818DRAFT_444588 [Hypoxylon cercidicola]|nr:hypothetical protein F4818DRAFT_444588 [Hypoxylon cercidicola]